MFCSSRMSQGVRHALRRTLSQQERLLPQCALLLYTTTQTRHVGHTPSHTKHDKLVASWYHRLWSLAQRSEELERLATPAQVQQQTPQQTAAKKDNATTGSNKEEEGDDDVQSTTTTNNTTTNTTLADPVALLAELRAVSRVSRGRMPAVMVENIWSLFDSLLPPYIQADLRHRLTPDYVHNFFSFVQLMAEVELDVKGVAAGLAGLQATLDRYRSITSALQSLSDSTTHSTQTEKDSTSTTTTTSKDTADNIILSDAELQRRRAELHDSLVHIKSDLTAACVRLRETGAPLHYTWLRHTAAMAHGVQRLMKLRRILFFFLTECKRRVSTLRGELGKKSQLSERDAAMAAQEMRFWLGRQRDVELLDNALATLFHDFFSKEYLVLEEMTWDTTPPALLEQLMRAETVHPFINGMLDMKTRLQPAHNRHLYAFLHHAVVNEPLIAVQVALTRGVARSVDDILHRPTPLADCANTCAAALAFRATQEQQQPSLNAAEVINNTQEGVTETMTSRSVEAREAVNTAIFYSINSAQSALRGLDMGSLLIKRAVREIENELNASRRAAGLPAITQFSTLSPIPGYVRWLSAEVEKLNRRAALHEATHNSANTNTSDNTETMTSATKTKTTGKFLQETIFGPECGTDTSAQAQYEAELEAQCYGPLRAAVRDYGARLQSNDEAVCLQRIAHALQSDNLLRANSETMKFLVRLFLAPDLRQPWWLDHTFTAALEAPLLRSIAHYLHNEKQRGRILDPVGNFHVSNGAIMYRLNFLANTTAQGSRESACVMVNYYYDLPRIETNVNAYMLHRTVAIGDALRDLLPPGSKPHPSAAEQQK